MAEHIYMFSGESERVSMKIEKFLVNDVIDWFGTDVSFFDETEDKVTARVTVNKRAMRYWARQYCGTVKLLSPPDLVETVKSDLQWALEQYEVE